MSLTNRYSNLARQDLLLTEYRFHIHYMEKDLRKILKKFWIDIQRSYQKLCLLQTVTLTWRDKTSSSPSIYSTSTIWKSASYNSCKISTEMQQSYLKVWSYKPILYPSATRPPSHQVSTPHPLYGKVSPEIPVKLRSRSNGRIKSYGSYKPLL
jgi:hypothetical protein